MNWNQIKPNPWLFCRISLIIFYSFYLDSYSGSKNTLKQVWAVGRFDVFAWRCITKFNYFMPSIGTLSEPVANTKNAFFSYKLNECNNSQRFLSLYNKLPDNWSLFGVPSFILCAFLQLFKVNDIISVNNCSEVFGVEKLNHFSCYNFVESSLEGLKLFLDLLI